MILNELPGWAYSDYGLKKMWHQADEVIDGKYIAYKEKEPNIDWYDNDLDINTINKIMNKEVSWL